MENMTTTAVFFCGQLGALSIILNLFVISALLRNRRRVLTNVFYVIVLHCAVLDVARGLCLIVYGMPYFANSFYNISPSISTKRSSLCFQASTFALVVLRICNMLTIFNLLIFTANEFIVIRYPLHYRRIMFFAILRMVCYTFILRTIKRFQEENGTLNKNNRYRIHRDSKKVQNDSNSRRWRIQAMSRHKYIYVIGTVLIVDLLFLFPYSGIQLVAFLHINHFIEISQGSTLIRWWLQVFIGVHSVCQPLCYFRMTEFRNLACCTSRVPWATLSRSLSQINRSFPLVRRNCWRNFCCNSLHSVDQFQLPNSALKRNHPVSPVESDWRSVFKRDITPSLKNFPLYPSFRRLSATRTSNHLYNDASSKIKAYCLLKA
uniref:G_PROTEIN_RECEP_F1_2 domain-containing protein n=1 Tax=Angiostrongylus cantonensis TaxID=6313 RepID=A0A158P963_ANGCA